MVKLLACGARGPGFDSRPRHSNFQRLVISCFQVEICEDFPECIPCDCRLTIKHILIECIDTADIGKQYFDCTGLKTLFNSVAGDTISAYL